MRLNKSEKEAICDALNFVLAGEIDDDLFSDDDVEAMRSALDKIISDLARSKG